MATTALSPTKTLPGPRRPLLGKNAQEWLAGYAFLTPALIILTLFIFIPIIFALIISFTDWTGIQPPNQANGVGLINYQHLLDPNLSAGHGFFQALRNTPFYLIIVLPLPHSLPLLLPPSLHSPY